MLNQPLTSQVPQWLHLPARHQPSTCYHQASLVAQAAATINMLQLANKGHVRHPNTIRPLLAYTARLNSQVATTPFLSIESCLLSKDCSLKLDALTTAETVNAQLGFVALCPPHTSFVKAAMLVVWSWTLLQVLQSKFLRPAWL